MQLLDETLVKPQVLILAPTHELAKQIKNVVDSLGYYLKINSMLLVGGTSVDNDRKTLNEVSPQVIVGTPGRVQDMIRRKALKTSTLKLLILDEADEMLSSGFKDQIAKIFRSYQKMLKLDYLAQQCRMN